MRPAELKGTERGNIWKKMSVSFKQTLRAKMSETHIEA